MVRSGARRTHDTGPAAEALRLVKVSRTYGSEDSAVRALDGVTLSLARGTFTAVMGPSGSGKSTLLQCAAGLDRPDGGIVMVDGTELTGDGEAALTRFRRRRIGFVFQQYNLLETLTVAQNTILPLKLAGRRVDRGRVQEILTAVGLGDRLGHRPDQLSGGQRQRVALARAIAVDPAVLLLDEPLGALDLALRRQMQEELVQLQRQLNATFVHVTHDQEEAMSIADRVVVMKDGRIEDMGPPARVYLKPASLFAARFMGENNLFEGQVIGRVNGQTAVDTIVGRLLVDQSASAGEKVHVALRPEQLRFSAELGAQVLGNAEITEFSFQGTHFRVHCRLAGQALIARVPAEEPPLAGEVLPLYARAGDLVLLRQ
jgi:putative ABC transport system ATP-binding protein